MKKTARERERLKRADKREAARIEHLERVEKAACAALKILTARASTDLPAVQFVCMAVPLAVGHLEEVLRPTHPKADR